MSAESDEPGERIAHIEGTLNQMNERLATVEGDVRDVRSEVYETRREMRRLFVALFIGLTGVIAVFQFLL